MLTPICHGCGNPLHSWNGRHLPVCVRCRDEINALPTVDRVRCICDILKARDKNFEVSALQKITGSMNVIADYIEGEETWEIEEDGA